MKKRFTSAEKTEFVKRYKNGTSVITICSETGIVKSTFYSWIKPYSIVLTKTGDQVNLRGFDALQKRNENLENITKILKHVACTVSSPLQEKLAAMEPLEGQFSGYLLGEALEVPRGTFYNHIFRRKSDDSGILIF